MQGFSDFAAGQGFAYEDLRCNFSYDNGRLVGKNYTYYFGEGYEYSEDHIIWHEEYDENGYISKKYISQKKSRSEERYNTYYSEYENILDETGKLAKQIARAENGDIKEESVYTYDENGNELSKVTTNFAEYTSKTSYTNTYNEDGSLAKTESIDDEGTKETKEYSYDANGNITKLTENSLRIYNTEPLETVTEYIYDENGRLVEETVIGKYTLYYEYDENGNLIFEGRKNNGEEEWDNTREYTFENGRCVSELYVDEGGIIQSDTGFNYQYTYDDKGNLVKKHCDFSDYTAYLEYSYDEDGNLIKYVDCDLYCVGVVYEYSDFIYIYASEK